MATVNFKSLPPNCRIVEPGNRPKRTDSAPPRDEQPAPAISTPLEPERVATPVNRRTSDKREEDQRLPRLRPGFHVATYEGFTGKRMTLWDMTEGQTEHMRQAALAAGIHEQL